MLKKDGGEQLRKFRHSALTSDLHTCTHSYTHAYTGTHVYKHMNENMDTKAPVHAFGYTCTIILIKVNMEIFVLVLARII